MLRALARDLRYYFCKFLEVALNGRKILSLGALLILWAHSAFKSGDFILYLHLLLPWNALVVRLTLPDQDFLHGAFKVLVQRRARPAHHLTCIRPDEALEEGHERAWILQHLFLHLLAAFFVNGTCLQALILVQQRNLQGRHKLMPARTLVSSTVLHRIYDAVQGHVIFVEALFEPLVQFLAYAGVHARLLLGDQVS